MKLNKLSAIFAFFLVFGLFMTSCDDTTTNPTEEPVKYPAAPTNLQATSVSETSIALKWTLSTSEADTDFKCYYLYVDGVKTGEEIAKGVSTLTLTGLESKAYNFALRSANTKDSVSTTAATITWATANRFENNINGNEIRVYITASDLGSGLDIFDATGLAPKALKVASIANWTVGLETKTANMIKFGPAAALEYTAASTRTVEMCTTPEFAADLSDLYDSKALDQSRTFSTSYVDLAALNVTAGSHPIFILRETRADGVHYAKVLVKFMGGKFLQGDGDNQYIECVVSYQKLPNTPYAK